MIDETLTRLIREAGQALDAIESPEHKAEMDKLAALDNERVALAEAVQNRVIAYTKAQEAIFAYRSADGRASEPVQCCGEGVPCNAPNCTGWATDPGYYLGPKPSIIDARNSITVGWGVTPNETDEFSSSRANGAYAED